MSDLEPDTIDDAIHMAERLPNGSKRKRSQSRDFHAAYAQAATTDAERESRTLKRSRASNWPVDEALKSKPAGAAEPAQNVPPRGIRRQQATFGLSSLNKRHAAARNAESLERERERERVREREIERASRFQEGSMNDKPSALPPSLFIRDTSNHSLAASAYSANVDHLMEEYHQDSPHPSIEPPYPLSTYPSHLYDFHEPASPSQTPSTTAKPFGLFRFGRMVASSFNPVNVWGSFSRTFKDTKDELTLRNVEENRRKAQQKADIEARYAELKAAGAFDKPTYTVVRARTDEALDGGHWHTQEMVESPAVADPVAVPHVSMPNPTLHAAAPRSSQGSRPASPGLAGQTLKSRKSIFGIHRPSLTNLKRVASDMSLTGAFSRQSTSLSPEKKDASQNPNDPLSLGTKSHTRKDVNKQQKLSKRVSDLESKLAQARHELTTAINSASPLPPLPSRFERFTPSKSTPTARFRAKFMPGKLPSLPSERFLSREQQSPVDPAEYAMAVDPMEIALPLHQKAIPNTVSEKPLPEPPVDMADMVEEPEAADDTIVVASGHQTPQQTEPATFNDLESRLKALDKAVSDKSRRKSGGARKRKDPDDKTYRPEKDSEVEEDHETPKKPRKKRKSGGAAVKNGANRGTSKAGSRTSSTARKENAPANKTRKAGTEFSRAVPSKPAVNLVSSDDEDYGSVGNGNKAQYDDHNEDTIVVAALPDTITVTEEDEIIRVSSRGSTKHTQKETITIASGSNASQPSHHLQQLAVIDDAISITPGVGDVPKMPLTDLTQGDARRIGNSTSRNASSVASKQDFEWPEDVF